MESTAASPRRPTGWSSAARTWPTTSRRSPRDATAAALGPGSPMVSTATSSGRAATSRTSRPCAGARAGRAVRGRAGREPPPQPAPDLFYGWELAEALALIPAEVPITGVVVGDGPGRPVLEAARDRLGLGDRLRLIGRVPHEEVPAWMNVFDVGLSTQTDDPVGWGRTTAKLPEYLACGTPVVCSDVGEAHRWLASSGQTLPYRGLRDRTYPARLAERLGTLRDQDLRPLRRRTATWRCGCSITRSCGSIFATFSPHEVHEAPLPNNDRDRRQRHHSRAIRRRRASQLLRDPARHPADPRRPRRCWLRRPVHQRGLASRARLHGISREMAS